MIGSRDPDNNYEQNGIINIIGKRIFSFNDWFVLREGNFWDNGLFINYKNGKKGVINLLGEEIIPTTYNSIELIHGLYYAEKNKSWSVFNNKGILLNSYLCDKLHWNKDKTNGIIVLNNKYSIINSSSKIISQSYSKIDYLNNSFFKASNNNKETNLDESDYIHNRKGGILNNKGLEITDFNTIYDKISCGEFYKGVCWCNLEDSQILFDTNGVKLITFKKNMWGYDFTKGIFTKIKFLPDSGLIREGLINNKGEIILPPKYKEIIYEDGSFVIVLDENNDYKILKLI